MPDTTPDEREFTDAERQRVRNVLTRVMDEMDDTGMLEDMYGPYARLVEMALTDSDITRALEETPHEFTQPEMAQIWSRTNP